MIALRLVWPLLAALLLAPTVAMSAELPSPAVYGFKGNIMLLDATGAAPRRLGAGRQPDLSPDGSAVWVENGEDQNRAQLAFYDASKKSVSAIAKPGGFLLSPRFVSGGKIVVFIRTTEQGRRELWTVQPGRQPERLIRGGGPAGNDIFEPMIEPGTGRIVYQDMSSLYRLSPDGDEISSTPLTTFTGGRQGVFTSADRFAFRPESGQIAFSMPVEGTEEFKRKVPDVSSALFLYDPATKKVTRLTPENVTAFDPAWSPDGSALFFTGYTDAQAGEAYPFRVMLLRPGEAPVELAPGEGPMPPGVR